MLALGMNRAGYGITVTLCCARGDAAHLQVLVDELESDGVPATIVEGIAEDPHILGPILDRQRGECVIAVFRGGAVGPPEYRRAAGVFGARKGPLHHLVGIPLQPSNPQAMLGGLHAALATVGGATTARDFGEPDDGSPTQKRDVVGVTQMSAVGSDAIPSHSRRVSGKRQIHESASGTYSMSPRPSSKRARPDAPPQPTAPATRNAPRRESSSPTALSDLDAELSRRMGEAAEDSGQRATLEPIATEALDGRTPSSLAGLSATVPSAPPVAFDKSEGAVDYELDPEPAPEPPRGPAPAPSAAPEKRWMSVSPVLLLVVLFAVAATAIILVLEKEDANTTSNRGVGEVADSDPNPETPGSETGAPSEPPPAQETETGAETEPPEIDLAEQGAVIREAISNGELRAIDLLVVADPGGGLQWHRASNHCKGKSFRGVGGWRLPSKDELKTLRKARLLTKGRYWSSTLALKVGAGSDHVYVLDLAARTVAPESKSAQDVLVLCVRSL